MEDKIMGMVAEIEARYVLNSRLTIKANYAAWECAWVKVALEFNMKNVSNAVCMSTVMTVGLLIPHTLSM